MINDSSKNTEDRRRTAVPWSFWIIGLIALVWNLMGCMNFYVQMNPQALANMPESHRAIAEARPLWATVGFAVSVLAGALGALLLLLKQSVAATVFMVSLLGTIVAMFHALVFAGAATVFSPFEIILGVALPLVLALFLVWYAKKVQRKGWIG